MITIRTKTVTLRNILTFPVQRIPVISSLSDGFVLVSEDGSTVITTEPDGTNQDPQIIKTEIQ